MWHTAIQEHPTPLECITNASVVAFSKIVYAFVDFKSYKTRDKSDKMISLIVYYNKHIISVKYITANIPGNELPPSV